MSYLKEKGVVYHAKVLELREVIENWLAYIPNTFPHYTRHTVRHSDEIVRQISKLLFKDDDPDQSVLPLTAVEAYLVIAAAYLHDAGMVVSDREKLELLQSEEWKIWVSGSNAGAKRWAEIQTLRHGNEPGDAVVRDFLADLETRFLVAEFVRRTHHLRARTVIEQHQAVLGRFAFDDLVLQRSIADLCVAHGLRTHELEDHERFPDRRDIRGDAVNMRLIAILLRLGDLLDMSADRACPLLLNAACPLPTDSLAHWTQYQRITHRLTAPDRIEITAECQNQSEHRVLQDWCQWIVDEVRAARTLLSRARRHQEYELPIAENEGNEKTITIRPSVKATYFPSSWTFQLDQDAVLQRLIYDAYKESHVFVRELIQNALDANRSQMYADLISDSKVPPQFPTQVAEEVRFRYPVSLSLKWIDVQNPLSEETEKRQVLTVSDVGIGMDKGIIERYFLQVGRSFYTTDEFRRNFRFVATSRFGIGFLSTFAVSDLVRVETFKPSSIDNDGPLRLTLTGPRNYLLTERGTRRASGTDIEVLLREPLAEGELTKLVQTWCRRVEFPVTVDDLGNSKTIVAEKPEQFVHDMPDISEPTARLVVRAFPVNRPGIEGELYVFARVTSEGEAWDKYNWAILSYPQLSPDAAIPELPGDLMCFHGIKLRSSTATPGGYCERFDYRGETDSTDLAREWIRRDQFTDDLWGQVLTEHLRSSGFSTAEDGWKYRQRLSEIFRFDSFWRLREGMIPLYVEGQRTLFSLDSVQNLPTLTIVVNVADKDSAEDSADSKETRAQTDSPTLFATDLISKRFASSILVKRVPSRIYSLTQRELAVDWILSEDDARLTHTMFRPIFRMKLSDPALIGCKIRWRRVSNWTFLNADNPFVKWLERVRHACRNCEHGLSPAQFDTIIVLLNLAFSGNLQRLQSYLDAWSKLPNLPPDLRLDNFRLSPEMFQLPTWQDPVKRISKSSKLQSRKDSSQ